VTEPGGRFRVGRVFSLYDPAFGEGGGLRNVVDAPDYLHAVHLLVQSRLALKRQRVAPDAPPPAPAPQTLEVIAKALKARMEVAEAQLWIWSNGGASYFEDFPQAAPITSLRETRG